MFKTFYKILICENKIIRQGLFRKDELYYKDCLIVVSFYKSIIEKKRAFISIPKKLNGIVEVIDTSKYGNLIPINKSGVMYCLYEEELHQLLEKYYIKAQHKFI